MKSYFTIFTLLFTFSGFCQYFNNRYEFEGNPDGALSVLESNGKYIQALAFDADR